MTKNNKRELIKMANEGFAEDGSSHADSWHVIIRILEGGKILDESDFLWVGYLLGGIKTENANKFFTFFSVNVGFCK